MQYDRISRESTTMNWLVPQIMDEIRNKQTIVTTVMGCGWVRQSGRRVEQKVCRDGDNEMSNNGASTASILGSHLDHRLRSGVFIFTGLQKCALAWGRVYHC